MHSYTQSPEIGWANFGSYPQNCLAGSTLKSPLIIMCAMDYYDYPENMKPKLLKNVRDHSAYNLFGQLLKINMSIPERLTCPLLAHVEHSYST